MSGTGSCDQVAVQGDAMRIAVFSETLSMDLAHPLRIFRMTRIRHRFRNCGDTVSIHNISRGWAVPEKSRSAAEAAIKVTDRATGDMHMTFSGAHRGNPN